MTAASGNGVRSGRTTGQHPATTKLAPIAAPEHEHALLRCYLDRPADVLNLPADKELFSDAQNAAVYEVLRELVVAGESVDVLTTTAALRARQSKVPASHVAYIATAERTTARVHLGVLRECSRRRLLDAIVREVTLNARDDTRDPLDVATECRVQLDALGSGYSRNGSLRFVLVDDETVENLPPPVPLVGDVLAVSSFAVLYGPPGVCKSFLALDLALCVAAGRPWHDRVVQPGYVVYVAAEGASGLGIRVAAWKRHHGIDGKVGVHFVTEAVNLLHADEVTDLLATIAGLPAAPVLVIVDTLARCLVGGDENSAKDVGLAIAALDRIRVATGATVLLLHHTAKHATTERGSGALRGAADSMLSLMGEDERVVLRSDKAKNAAPFDDIALQLFPIELRDGATSAVLVPTNDRPQPAGQLTANALKALRTLVDLFDDDGAAYGGWIAAAELSDRTFRRTLKALSKCGYVELRPIGKKSQYVPTEAGKSLTGARADNRHAGGAGSDRQAPAQPARPFRGAGDAGSGERPDAGRAMDAATLLMAAQTAGYPRLDLRPGISVMSGRDVWERFAHNGTIEDITAASEALSR